MLLTYFLTACLDSRIKVTGRRVTCSMTYAIEMKECINAITGIMDMM